MAWAHILAQGYVVTLGRLLNLRFPVVKIGLVKHPLHRITMRL